MTGGLLVLAAYGAQDVYLTGNPQITFFVAVYRRYTNFSIINTPQYFTGNFDFGTKVYCPIERVGDLMSSVFLRVKLPSLLPYAYTDDNDNAVEFFWINAVGHALIKIIEIEIGGNVIDRQYGVWLEIWSELTVPVGKKEGYNSMVGKTNNPVNFSNNQELLLYVPLQFWFCRNIGLALPLIALQYQEVRINVTTRNYSELIISSTGELIASSPNKNPLEITYANLEVDYVYLEENERKIFTRNNLQYLIEQLQVYATSLEPKNRQVQGSQFINFNFNHPMKELVWVIQNTEVLTTYPYGGNEWFNFSTQSYKNGVINGKDPMLEGRFIFNGQDLTEHKPSKYYRTIVPYQRHTNVPNNYIYVYSFALHPEEYQPSGTCNFSRIDNQELHMTLSLEIEASIIQLFGLNVNILNIAEGMAGVEYSS